MSWVAVAIGGSAILGAATSMSAADKAAGASKDASNMAQANYQQTRTDLMPWQQGGQAANQRLLYLLGLGGIGQAPQQSQFMTTQQTDPRAIPIGMGGQTAPVFATNNGYAGFPTAYNQMNAQMAGGTQQVPDVQAYQTALAQYQQQQGQQSNDPAFGSLLKPFSLDQFNQSPAYQFNLQQGQDALNKSAAARGNYYAPTTLQDLSKFTQGMASNEFMNAYNMYNQDQSNVYNRLFNVSGSGQSAANQTGAFGAGATQYSGNALQNAGLASGAGIMGAGNAIGGGVLGLGQLLAAQNQPQLGGSAAQYAYASAPYAPEGYSYF